MLPVPSSKYVPKFLDSTDPAGIAFTNMLDSEFTAWLNDVRGLQWLIYPDRCPAALLNVFGYGLYAGIAGTDTEAQKRQKIYNAISVHKVRGQWLADVEIKINAVTGDDAEIVDRLSQSDSVFIGSGQDWELTGNNWARFGGDGTYNIGEPFIGAGVEIQLPGVIYIDIHPATHTAVMTADQILTIYNNILDSIPAYFRVFLCYTDVSGILQIYQQIN